MLITYYNPETFERNGTIPKVESISWNKRFYEVGSFELRLQKTDIQRNDIILHGDNAGIVMEISKETPNGVAVYGYDLKGLAEFRYIETSVIYKNKTPEYIMKDLATIFFKTGEREITGFKIEEDTGEGEPIPEYTVETGFLSEQLEKISKKYHIGYDITFDEAKIFFTTRYSVDNLNVTFSRRHHNIENAVYTQSNFNTYNVAYAEDENKAVVSQGTAKGILRREGHTSKLAELETFLAEKQPVENIEATAAQKLVFGLDYNLGDNVNVVFEDLQTQKVISAVQIHCERGDAKIYPSFGAEKQNPIKKLLREG